MSNLFFGLLCKANWCARIICFQGRACREGAGGGRGLAEGSEAALDGAETVKSASYGKPFSAGKEVQECQTRMEADREEEVWAGWAVRLQQGPAAIAYVQSAAIMNRINRDSRVRKNPAPGAEH